MGSAAVSFSHSVNFVFAKSTRKLSVSALRSAARRLSGTCRTFISCSFASYIACIELSRATFTSKFSMALSFAVPSAAVAVAICESSVILKAWANMRAFHATSYFATISS